VDCCDRVWQTGESEKYLTQYTTKEGETSYFDVWIGPVLVKKIAYCFQFKISTLIRKTSKLLVDHILEESSTTTTTDPLPEGDVR
jgi:hypothetical protein